MGKFTLYHEQELLQQIANGNEQAFRQLFDYYAPKINAYALTLTHSSLMAEEIVQEVFTNIWSNRLQLATIHSIEAWLITLARNTGSNMLRRMAHEQLIIRELENDTATTHHLEYSLEWKQYHEKLYKAVASLSPQQQKVWIMSRRYGMKQQQIADELNISLYTVKEYLKKATNFLKDSLLKFIFYSHPPLFSFLFVFLL